MTIKRKLILIAGLALLATAAASSFYIDGLIRKAEHLNYLSTARAFFQQIQLTRSWVALQGGVFIEKKPGVETNPFLKKIGGVKYDIADTAGVEYTLRNPALVTRQISELAETNAIFKFHITSLNLVNPLNAPDAFEAEALRSFEKGSRERFEYVGSPDGKVIKFRYMAPLFVEKSCLGCHLYQNYREGQVRGGISVTIPADGGLAAPAGTLKPFVTAWMIALLAVIVVIYFAFNHFVINPIKSLAMDCERVSAGDYSKSITAGSDDEIGSLAAAFEKMRATAFEYMTDLEKKVEERTEALVAEQKKTAAARDAAEKASRAKSDFLAMMSHEIRTPLNSVIGFSELFDRNGLTPSQLESLDYISSGAKFLSAMINDILDFSKIEAGRLELENAPFSVRGVVGETVKILLATASKKSVALQTDIDERLDCMVRGDGNRLTQILLNLAGNAVKFTRAGSVRIKVTLAEEMETRLKLAFEVKDDGPGIPPEKLERIFAPFNQSDPAVARVFGGTGLGLAISDRLARLMGAERIFVESFPGGGSRFYFTIDFEKCGREARTESGEPGGLAGIEPAKGGRGPYMILLAEDNPANVKLVKMLVERAGHRLVTAENGKIAYEMALADKFDAILMDVQMPVMDGMESARMIRAAGVKTPIIALTADAVTSEREAGLAAGMDEYMTKPLNMRRLEKLIYELIDKKSKF